MASIRKRNNKWQVQVRRKGAGSIAKSFMSKSEAMKWAYKQELKMESGLHGHICPKEVTLRDLLERYKSEITPTKRGATQETRRINRLMRDPVTSKSTFIQLADITPPRLATPITRVSAPAARATAKDISGKSICA